jgi:transmembrane sensor
MTDGREGVGGGIDAGGDLARTLEAARRAAPAVTASRSQKWHWAVLSRLDGRPRRRSPALAAAFVAAAVLAIVGWRALAPGPYAIAPSSAPARDQAASPGGPSAHAPYTLADGSRVIPDGPTTVLERVVESGDDILYELKTGGARFEVARRPSRTFRVHAGPVTLQVIGTRFEVQRFEDRSHVSVTEGRVLVSWWGGSRELGAGEAGTFPPQPAPPADGAVASTATSAPARRRAPEPGPEVLFAHADRDRKAGKPELAVAHLRTLIDRFPADPHAHVAAFTIGRLLLESLGQPRQAAASFERARILAKGAPVAEDALAREVEAWAAAGERALASRRADLYRQLYPNGARLGAVLRAGGLEKSAP